MHRVRINSKAVHYYTATAICQTCPDHPKAERQGNTLGEARSKANAWAKDHKAVHMAMENKREEANASAT